MKRKTLFKRILSYTLTAAIVSGAGLSALADDKVTAANAKLTVDVSDKRTEIIHGAGGFLYGIADEEVPTSNTVVPLKPKVLCTGTMLTTEHPYGDAANVAEQFLEDGGEQVMMYLPNYYGYALGVSADYREYAKVMRDKVVPYVVEWKENWKEKHGVKSGSPDALAQRIDIDKAIIYLPINEGAPRVGTDDFGVAWLEYYRAIKSVDPNATIGGTNDWSYNSAFGVHPDGTRNYELKDFLPFCIANDCLPDIFTWHELDTYDMRDMLAHKAHFENAWNTAFTDAGKTVPELPQFVINEYATMDDCGVPGRLVNWIARFEECGFYACLPFWHQGNSLNDLASDANEGSGSWWTYKWYGDMSGTLLGVESNTVYDELYGLATLDDNKKNVKVLLGGQDGSATVQINNIGESETFKSAKKVHIKVEASDYAGMIGTQFETDTVLEGNYPVSSDGSVSFDIGNMKFSTSFCATVTPAADDADTTVKYTAPYIGYYEAEKAEVSGGAENCNRFIGGSYWGASSYISDDSLVYTRVNGATLTYTIDVPTDGRYELNFIYGNGQGTTRNTPETSLSENLCQNMTVDGGAPVKLTMNNTLLTNTTGSKRVFLDLRAGSHTVALTSLRDGELLHDLVVVKYKGEYGKDIVFDKTYEGEDADFNELIGTKTAMSTQTDGDGTTYVTGLSAKRVTEGGGARYSVVVRDSGMYNVVFRYKSPSNGNINIYVGNTAITLNRLRASAPVSAAAARTETGAAIYLEKGINVVDIDADADIMLDSMRVYAAPVSAAAIEAEECIPAGDEALFEVKESVDAESGKYLAGMAGADTAKGEGKGIAVEIAKERLTLEDNGDLTLDTTVTAGVMTARIENNTDETSDAVLYAAGYNADGTLSELKKLDITLEAGASVKKEIPMANTANAKAFLWDAGMKPMTGGTACGDVFKLTVKAANTTDGDKTINLRAVLNNTEYAEYSNPDVDYPNENTQLSSDTKTLTVAAGKTAAATMYLDASTLKKPEGYLENEPQPNDGYGGPFRKNSDEFFHEIKLSVTDESGAALMPDIDATYASKTSAKDTPGGYIELKYSAPADGTYALRVFHSNDELCGEHPYNTKIIDRYMNVAVTDKDGNETSDETYFFMNTYSRDTFKEKTIMLDLKAGENTIRMYNNDSVSRWYGGDVAMPSQMRQKNCAPNLDKFIIEPAKGVYDASKAPAAESPNHLIPVSGYVSEYEDTYIENAGFGSGSADGWTAENVTVGLSAQNSFDGYYARLESGAVLSQTAKTAGLYGDGCLSVYSKGENAEGRAYLVLNDGGTVVRKALALGDEYDAAVIHYSFTGTDVEVSIDASELTGGAVYADSFRVAPVNTSRWNASSAYEYFVDCGDHYPASLCYMDSFGSRNGVTDQIYGVDEVTGYKWGVYVTDEDPAFDGEDIAGSSEGAWTRYQWPNQWGVREQSSKSDSFRYTFARQNAENGFGGKHYIRYKFELDPGTYTLKLGQQAMWWNGGPYDVVVNGTAVDTYSISSEDGWASTVYNEHECQFTVEDGEDSALISLESDSDIWLTYMYIIKEAELGTTKLYRDDFTEDTASRYESPGAIDISVNEYGELVAQMSDGWDENYETNFVLLDATEYLAGHSGEEITASVTAGFYGAAELRVSFEVRGADGEVKSEIPAASVMTEDGGTAATAAGSAAIDFGDDDRVYLKIAHPTGYHVIKSIELSAKSLPEIVDNGSMLTALAAGGNYVLGRERVVIANAGTADESNLAGGVIDGEGKTMIKGEGADYGAMLYHNNAVNWTYKNMTIDGNKSVITHSDACLWFMNGAEITFRNVKIQNFKTTGADKAAVNNVGGTVTFDSVEFSGNENAGANAEKYGEYADILSAPWGNAVIRLVGATKAKIYYVSGTLDVSGLASGSAVSVKADSAESYDFLKSLEYDSSAVSMVCDDENMTVSFTGA